MNGRNFNMDERFKKIVDIVLGHEGGYVNDSRDPGGETNWSISKRSYPNVNIAILTKKNATKIYYNDYYLPNKYDKLHAKSALVCFDSAVNSGSKQANKWLQEAVGATPDGVIGPNTLDEYNAYVRANGEIKVVENILYNRLIFMSNLAIWPTYKKGWTRRIISLALEDVS